jgi:polar amino acid transport system substrate-binding protein
MFKYEALNSYVTYISPLPSLENVVIGLRDSKFKKVSDLEGKRIAYLRGAKFSDVIDNNNKIIKITTHDFHQGIDMLMAKRVDAIIGPIDPIIVAAKKLTDSDNLFGIPLVVSTRTPWLQISNASKLRNSTEVIKAHFNDILSSGELQILRTKYLSNTNTHTKTTE